MAFHFVADDRFFSFLDSPVFVGNCFSCRWIVCVPHWHIVGASELEVSVRAFVLVVLLALNVPVTEDVGLAVPAEGRKRLALGGSVDVLVVLWLVVFDFLDVGHCKCVADHDVFWAVAFNDGGGFGIG